MTMEALCCKQSAIITRIYVQGSGYGFNRAQGALVWEYLLLAFGDVKGVTIQTQRRLGRHLFVPFLFSFCFSPCRSGSNFFLLVSTSVLDRSSHQPPPFSFKALSLIQIDSPSARDPRSAFSLLSSIRVLPGYKKFGGLRIAFVRACLLTFIFLDH